MRFMSDFMDEDRLMLRIEETTTSTVKNILYCMYHPVSQKYLLCGKRKIHTIETDQPAIGPESIPFHLYFTTLGKVHDFLACFFHECQTCVQLYGFYRFPNDFDEITFEYLEDECSNLKELVKKTMPVISKFTIQTRHDDADNFRYRQWMETMMGLLSH